jgi:hypothetical protein
MATIILITRKGLKIFIFFRPAALSATYSESPDILERQKIVEKKMETGIAIGTSVVITLKIKPIIKPMLISSDETRLIIRNSSKVIRKDTKKLVLTTKGRIKLEAI